MNIILLLMMIVVILVIMIIPVSVKITLLRKITRIGMLAFRAPNQGQDRSFCRWVAWAGVSRLCSPDVWIPMLPERKSVPRFCPSTIKQLFAPLDFVRVILAQGPS